MLAWKTQEDLSSDLMYTSKELCGPRIPVWGVRDRQVPGALWSVNLTELVSSRLTEKMLPYHSGCRMVKENTRSQPAPAQTSIKSHVELFPRKCLKILLHDLIF